MAHSVFVSYSAPDSQCAFELVERLEARGVTVWVAPRDISPAADWAAEIIAAISATRIMVLVFSSHSNGSPQVRREVERAVHKQIPILPFRIENVLPASSLEYFLSTQHWLDAYPPPREPYYERLCAHLELLLDQQADVRPASASPESATTARVPLPKAAIRPGPTLLPAAGQLEQLERALAEHLGPIARILVKRAAAKAADWQQLMAELASQVEPEEARRTFLDVCRRSQH